MLTWNTQTPPCAQIFYLHSSHYLLYADLAHPYISCFLNVLGIYADLYHPDPSYVQIFNLHHPLYADLAHPYINHFLNMIYVSNVSMLTWNAQTPSCAQMFDLHSSHYLLYA